MSSLGSVHHQKRSLKQSGVTTLTALEEKNYMPIRKDRCYKNLWIITLFKGESLESRNTLY